MSKDLEGYRDLDGLDHRDQRVGLLLDLDKYRGIIVGLWNNIFIHWTSILASLSIFCVLLLLLIFLFLPSQEDQRFDFSVISQIFYGRQLRPVLLTVDLKAFITCRIGFTFWALYLISSIFEYQKLYPNDKPSC
ncbi:unnamed protein product [Meloidogyne enterolobii]|uniref:Uncharacterized protein n=1 Tax=Meloidogyne enterolobii TaxID=390850 RepID=A0ACB0XYB7_MELEN